MFTTPEHDDLIALKRTGTEKGTLNSVDLEFHQAEYERLTHEVDPARERKAFTPIDVSHTMQSLYSRVESE